MTAPYVVTSQTSEEAADRIAPHLSELQERVLATLQHHPTGLTDEEMQFWYDIKPSTQRPRRVELVNKGLVIDSGLTRPTRSGRKATVWRAVVKP